MSEPNAKPLTLEYGVEKHAVLSSGAFAGLFYVGHLVGWCVDSAFYALVLQRDLRPPEINLRLGSLMFVVICMFLFRSLIVRGSRRTQIAVALASGMLGMVPGAILASR